MPRKTRQHARVRAKNLVANVEAEQERLTGCVVENISLGGVLLRTGGRLPDGAAVILELVGPGLRKALRFHACVVGLEENPRGMRLQFVEEHPEERQRLAELLESFGLRRSVPRPAGREPTPAPYAARPVALPQGDEPLAMPRPAAPVAPLTSRTPMPVPSRPTAPPLPQRTPNPVPAIAPMRVGEARPAAPAATVVVPTPAPMAAAAPTPAQVNERLMLQVKGLIMQLSEAQEKIARQETEIAELRQKLEAATRR